MKVYLCNYCSGHGGKVNGCANVLCGEAIGDDVTVYPPQEKTANKQMTVASTGGLRANKGKFPYSRIHKSVVAAFGEVTFKSSIKGGGKYPDYNYKKGLPQTEVADSALRHIYDYLAGNDLDSESGIHTLKHALWNIALMVEQLETHPELDDRYKPNKESK